MKLISEVRNEYITLLTQACLEDIKHIKMKYASEPVFSYAILCCDGFMALGGVCCNRKYASEHSQKLIELGIKSDKEISEAVNTPEWHSKMIEAYFNILEDS